MEGNSNNQNFEMLYAGEFTHAMDLQRRVAIPSEWRSKEGENRFYLLPGRHKALQLMPYHAFKDMADKLKRASTVDPKATLALARLGSKSKECIPDKQGRIHIPEQLLEYAEIKRGDYVDSDLCLIGAVNTIQIWSRDNWSKNSISDEDTLNEIQSIEELR